MMASVLYFLYNWTSNWDTYKHTHPETDYIHCLLYCVRNKTWGNLTDKMCWLWTRTLISGLGFSGLLPGWSVVRGSPPLRGCFGGCVGEMSFYVRQKLKTPSRTPLRSVKFQMIHHFSLMAIRFKCLCDVHIVVFHLTFMSHRVIRCTSLSSSSSSKVTSWRTGSRRSVKGILPCTFFTFILNWSYTTEYYCVQLIPFQEVVLWE